MSRSTSIEERQRIMELSDQGLTDREIAIRMNLSASTVRKWRRRGQRGGASALVSRMGRPATGPMSTFAREVETRIEQMREDHPGWGPKTLLTELQLDKQSPNKLPSTSTIKRFLKEKGLSDPYSYHTELPQGPHQTPPEHAHEQWEMDARGREYVSDVGVVALINVNDRYSHARLGSYPCYLGHKRAVRFPRTADYQLALRLAFMDWGMPESIGVDHDPVFYDSDSPSPYPTRFHLWLIGLGIHLIFGRMGVATDQAMTERSHQLWEQQVLRGQRFNNWDALFQALKQRRDFLNYHLPCATLGERPIMSAFPQTRYSERVYRPEWEAKIFNTQRIYKYLAQGKWFRKTSINGVLSLGGYPYNMTRRWAQREIEIRFDTQYNQFQFINHNDSEIKHKPLQGCSPQELMGELKPATSLADKQMVLPFSYEDWRKMKIYTAQSGTTL